MLIFEILCDAHFLKSHLISSFSNILCLLMQTNRPYICIYMKYAFCSWDAIGFVKSIYNRVKAHSQLCYMSELIDFLKRINFRVLIHLPDCETLLDNKNHVQIIVHSFLSFQAFPIWMYLQGKLQENKTPFLLSPTHSPFENSTSTHLAICFI